MVPISIRKVMMVPRSLRMKTTAAPLTQALTLDFLSSWTFFLQLVISKRPLFWLYTHFFPSLLLVFLTRFSCLTSLGLLCPYSRCLQFSFLNFLLSHGLFRSGGHVQFTAFFLCFRLCQKPLVVFSLISTIKSFPSALPWSDQILSLYT